MKKLISNSNPFILILLPVLFALLMGVSYQFEQKASADFKQVGQFNVKHSTSLFYKGISLVKTVCGVAKQDVW
jgi:cytochrome c biogenesis protein CcdA